MTPDRELLQCYVRNGDEAAFAEIVRRQADLVYSVALRQVRDAQLAQDVTQAVFTKLARQASQLCQYDTLVGWLHTTTRYTAIDTVRGEARRRTREQEASAMQLHETSVEINWEAISPLLDEAVGSLGEADRKAVLLRFFQNRTHQEIGVVLGLSENSANKRIERALEKLRGYFARHGVTTTSAILATAISTNSVQAAPVGLAEKITPAALMGAGTAGVGSLFLFALMSTKTKTILALTVFVAIAATVAFTLRSANESTPTVLPASRHQQLPVASGPHLAARVAAPALPPTPSDMAAMAGASTPMNDPQADLNFVLPDIANSLQAGDLASLYVRYLPPDYVAQMPPQVLTQLPQQAYNLMADPNARQRMMDVAKLLQALQAQIPVFNAAGDQATYKLDTYTAEIKTLSTNIKLQEVTFVKQNGKWYVSVREGDLLF